MTEMEIWNADKLDGVFRQRNEGFFGSDLKVKVKKIPVWYRCQCGGESIGYEENWYINSKTIKLRATRAVCVKCLKTTFIPENERKIKAPEQVNIFKKLIAIIKVRIPLL